MTFRVGQKVVCIRNRWFTRPYKGEVFPSLGEVYTIRALVDYGYGPLGLQFFEIRNPKYYRSEDCDFRADNFRPVVARKTDISIFTAMLNHSQQGVSDAAGAL